MAITVRNLVKQLTIRYSKWLSNVYEYIISLSPLIWKQQSYDTLQIINKTQTNKQYGNETVDEMQFCIYFVI